MPRWKIGDRIVFQFSESSFEDDEIFFGTIGSVHERVGADTLYSIVWDDGFEDGAGNFIPEWDLYDTVEWEDKVARNISTT
jgi:hypothetical protein